jgi:hypothetical protein
MKYTTNLEQQINQAEKSILENIIEYLELYHEPNTVFFYDVIQTAKDDVVDAIRSTHDKDSLKDCGAYLIAYINLADKFGTQIYHEQLDPLRAVLRNQP